MTRTYNNYDGSFEAREAYLSRLAADVDDYGVDDWNNEAWDCDPDHSHYVEEVDSGLDFDNYPSEDWQAVCLDRFGDRLIAGRY